MKHIFKRVTATVLSIALILGMLYIPTFAATVAEGTNNKTIYLSASFTSDAKGNDEIISAAANSEFYIWVNFFGNSGDENECVQAYNLLIGYNNKKISLGKAASGYASPDAFKADFAEGIAYAGWASLDGFYDEDEDIIAVSGKLFRIKATALEDLSIDELREIRFVDKAEGAAGTQETKFIDGNDTLYTIISTPAIAVGNVVGDIYKDTSAAAIKDMISSVTYVGQDGTASIYTKANTEEWDKLSVAIPAAGLKVGDNTLTASYDGYTCEFEINVLDRVDRIEITTAPTKTVYTAFDKFDASGMVITAVYESGKTEAVTNACTVDTVTALKVGNTEWTVSFGTKTAKQAITVSPKQITAPVISAEPFMYNTAEQPVKYAVEADSDYVSINGDVKGKHVGSYKVTASLKDKVNTVWAGIGGTADITLDWAILPIEITSGLRTFDAMYTTTYAELVTSDYVSGILNEGVKAKIDWYTDAACTVPASSNAQIADKYTGDGQTVLLYYKASGMRDYNDYLGSVSVNVTDKNVGSIEWTTLPNGIITSAGEYFAVYSTNGYAVSADMFTVEAHNGSVINTEAGAVKTVTIRNDKKDAVDKLTDVGRYTITVEYSDKTNQAIEIFYVSIEPKSIDGSVVSLKVGNGSAVATSSSTPLTVTYTSSEIAPVAAAVSSINAADFVVDANAVGTILSAINVSGDTFKIAVKGVGNYTGTAYGYWKIVPAEIFATGFSVNTKKYNGRVDDIKDYIRELRFSGLCGNDSLVIGKDYTITGGTYSDKNAGTNIDASVKFKLEATAVASNYVLANDTTRVKANIAKADSPVLTSTAVGTLLSSSVVSGSKDYVFDIASIINGIPSDAGDVSYSIKADGVYASGTVNGTKLKLTVAQAPAAGVTDKVTVTVTMENYNDSDAVLNFVFKNKTSVTVTLDNINAVYGTTYTVAAKYADQPASGYTWKYVYEGIEGTVYQASSVPPTDAGTYRVTANYEDNTPDANDPMIHGHVGTASATLKIAPKALTVADGTVAVTKVYDGTANAGTLTGTLALNGKVGNDDVSINMSTVTVGAYGGTDVSTYAIELGGITLASCV